MAVGFLDPLPQSRLTGCANGKIEFLFVFFVPLPESTLLLWVTSIFNKTTFLDTSGQKSLLQMVRFAKQLRGELNLLKICGNQKIGNALLIAND